MRSFPRHAHSPGTLIPPARSFPQYAHVRRKRTRPSGRFAGLRGRAVTLARSGVGLGRSETGRCSTSRGASWGGGGGPRSRMSADRTQFLPARAARPCGGRAQLASPPPRRCRESPLGQILSRPRQNLSRRGGAEREGAARGGDKPTMLPPKRPDAIETLRNDLSLNASIRCPCHKNEPIDGL
jgi:hypothetical protein